MSKNPVATNHTELIAWRLCAALRRLVLRYTREGPAREDYRFRNQIRSAARSACYLTSEGFYRKRDGDFINFLVMARGSLGEAGDQIEDGAESEYFTESQRVEMIRLMKRACKANSGLRRYLETAQNMRKRSSLTGRMKEPNGP